MLKKISFSLLINVLSIGPVHSELWTASIGMGLTHIPNMSSSDGNYASMRFALDKKIYKKKSLSFGIEAAVETGNEMTLNIPQTIIDKVGGLPVGSRLKTMLELLATLKTPLSSNYDVFIKAGMALRTWQLDERCDMGGNTKLSPDLHFGIDYFITPQTHLFASYRYIFDKGITHSFNQISEVIHIAGMPIQNGALLGVKFLIG